MTQSDIASDVRIEPMITPRTLGDADAAGLHGMIDVQRACTVADYGYADLAYTASECLAALAHQNYHRTVRLLVWDAGRVAGFASIGMSLVDDIDRARVFVAVHPDLRRRGIGSALYARLMEVCRENGRTILLSDSDHSDEAADQSEVTAKSGAGSVPCNAGTRFALAHSFRLEQVERYSVLRLPANDAGALSRLETEAAERARAPHDYRLVTWKDSCPDNRVDDMAWLYTRMSTDAPSAGIEAIEEKWDAARVRDSEATLARQGRTALICAAEHVPSGRLVAFTELVLTDHDDTFAFQNDTLVLAEHRGRKLGQLVKIGNLRELAATDPRVRRVHTWNAAENSYMLAVNIALGFETAGWCGQWQRIGATERGPATS